MTATATMTQATTVLEAFAASDLDTVRNVCRQDVVVFGTDPGERWTALESFVEALDGMRHLGLHAAWAESPAIGDGWVAGVATYSGTSMPPLPVRVTLAFDTDGRVAHAHFSVETEVG